LFIFVPADVVDFSCTVKNAKEKESNFKQCCLWEKVEYIILCRDISSKLGASQMLPVSKAR